MLLLSLGWHRTSKLAITALFTFLCLVEHGLRRRVWEIDNPMENDIWYADTNFSTNTDMTSIDKYNPSADISHKHPHGKICFQVNADKWNILVTVFVEENQLSLVEIIPIVSYWSPTFCYGQIDSKHLIAYWNDSYEYLTLQDGVLTNMKQIIKTETRITRTHKF